jgi:hypothetical protein
MKRENKMLRSAIAMIELIFAIVIIAISVLTIPSMMHIASNASKNMAIDDDVIARISGWSVDKFQGRWDKDYNASQTGPLWISPSSGDLGCSRGSGNSWYRLNTTSMIACNDHNLTPSTIPTLGDGNISRGIEQLNGGTEPITITTSNGTIQTLMANYSVAYVPSTVTVSGNTATATWTLGSSATMNPSPSGGVTHLKRVVTRFYDTNNSADVVLTFFKSNKGN